MENIQKIQNIVDNNKEKFTSDDYNAICMQMKEIFKKKEKEPTEYVKIKYIDYPIAAAQSGYDGDSEDNCCGIHRRLYINIEPKIAVIKLSNEKYEKYNNVFKTNGYLSLYCQEIDNNCDCSRDHTQDYLIGELDMYFNIDKHIVVQIERIN